MPQPAALACITSALEAHDSPLGPLKLEHDALLGELYALSSRVACGEPVYDELEPLLSRARLHLRAQEIAKTAV